MYKLQVVFIESGPVIFLLLNQNNKKKRRYITNYISYLWI